MVVFAWSARAQVQVDLTSMNEWQVGVSKGTFTPTTTQNAGWLTMTSAATQEATYVVYKGDGTAAKPASFSGVNTSVYADFYYRSYGGTGADGINFFLYDASKNSLSNFQLGYWGGSLGYANFYDAPPGTTLTTPGMKGGYLGVGLDEFGNYSYQDDSGYVGSKNGGPGFTPNAIAVRGPGQGLNGNEPTGYQYLGGTSSLSTALSTTSSSAPSSGAGFAHVVIYLSATNQLTVSMARDTTSALTPILSIDVSSYARPDQLGFGFTGATGGSTNIHEISQLTFAAIPNFLWKNNVGNNAWSSSGNWYNTSLVPGSIATPNSDVLLDNSYVSSAQSIDISDTKTLRNLSIDAPFNYNLNSGTLQFSGSTGTGSGIFITNTKGTGATQHTISSAIDMLGDIQVSNTTATVLSLDGNISTNGNLINFTGSGNTTVNGSINPSTSAGNVRKTGLGITTLAGQAHYTGNTEIQEGMLKLGASDRLSASSTLNISGGILNLNGNSQRISGLTFTNGTIDYGTTSGANSFLFDNIYAAPSGVITIQNWEQALDILATQNGALSATYLSQIYFSGFGTGATLDNTGTSVSGYGSGWYKLTPVATSWFTWDGQTNNVWTNATNWSPDGVPGSLPNIAFGTATAGNRNVTLGTNQTVNALRFDAGGSGGYDIGNGSATYTLTMGNGTGTSFILQKSDTFAQVVSAPVALASNTVVDTIGSQTLSFTGVMSGASNLVKEGVGGKLLLTGANTFTGNVYINAGTLQISNGAALGTTAGKTIIADGATLELTNNISTGETIDVDGFGVSGVGVIRNFSGNNTLSGTINLLDAARLTAESGTTMTVSGSILSASGRDLNVTGSGNVTISGSIATGSGGMNVAMGAVGNILTLSGSNSFRGALAISQGTVTLGASDRLYDLVPVQMTGGLFNLNNFSDAIGSLSGTGGSVTLGSGTLTVGDNNASTSFGGTISGTGTLAKRGTGTLSLSTASSYSGGTALSAGTLSLSNNTALGTSAVTLSGGTLTSTASNTIANTITITGDAAITNLSVSGAFTQSNADRILTLDNSTLSGTTNLSNNSTSRNLTVSVSPGAVSTISGVVANGSSSTAGSLTKADTGTLILSGSNTYGGSTAVNAGVLNVRNSAALGTQGTTVSTGAQLQLEGSGVIAGEALTLNGTGIANDGALRNISGSNGWSGAITLGSAARMNSDSGTMTVSGGIGGAGIDLTVGGAGATTLSGVVGTGAGTLTKDGSGTLTLSAVNTFTGGMTINNGTVTISAADRLANTLPLTLNSGTFNLNNFNETLGSLAGSGGTVSLGSATLTVGGNNTSTTFTGSLTGTGVLSKAGTGVMGLTGASTYSGLTNVTAGAINVQNATALGSTAAGTVVSSGAELQLQGGVSVGAETLGLSGNGLSTTGALHNIWGNNTWGGAVTLNANTRINSDSDTLTIDVVSGNAITGTNRALSVGGAGNITIADPIATGTGTLTKDGTGTLTLSGANTYTGTTTISGGILRLGAGNVISNSATNHLVLAGGTLNLNGNSQQLQGLSFTSDSVIDFGSAAGSNYLLFNSYNGATTPGGVLTINNYEDGSDILGVLDSNRTTFSSTVLASIYFSGFGPGGQLAASSTSSIPGYSGTWRSIIPGSTGTDRIWTSNSSSTWGTSGNWSGSNVPNSNTEVAVFDGSGTQTTVNFSANNNILGVKFSGALGYTVQNTATMTLTSAATNGIAYIQQTGTANQSVSGGTVALGKDVVLDVTSSGNLSISSTITGSASSSLTKAGTGTGVLQLSGPSSFSGNVYLTAGATAISNNTALGNTTGTTTISSGAELQLLNNISVAEAMTVNGTGASSVGALRNISGNNTVSGAITLGSNTRVNSDSGTFTVSGVISGSGQDLSIGGSGDSTFSNTIGTGTGALTKDGSGTLNLSGANTFSGATSITSGTVIAQNASALGTPTSGTTTTSISSGAQLRLSGGISVVREDITLNGTGLATDGALRNTSGNNSWAGGVILGSSSQINSDSGTLTLGGAISGSGQNLTVGGAGNLTLSNTGSLGTGTGSLTKDGTGTLTLTGNTTHTGGTTIDAGTVTLGASDRLSDTANLTVNTGGTFNLANYNESIGSLSGTGGSVTLGSGTLTAGGANTNSSYSGVISGTGGVTKIGSGTLNLSDANTFTGTMAINSGNLQLGDDNVLANTIAVNISSGAVFDVNGHTETIGHLTSTGGTLSIGSGTLTLGDASNTGFVGTINSAANGTLIKQNSGTLTITSNVNIAGTVQVTTGSTLEFVSGATIANLNLDGGTLKLGGTGSTYNFTNLTISGNSTIEFSGSVTLNSVTITTNSGAILNVTSWTELQDYFFASTWKTSISDPGIDYTNAPSRGSSPLSQVVFAGYSGGNTAWIPWGGVHGEITPVPEPSTYGAIFTGTALAFVGLFRLQRRRKEDKRTSKDRLIGLNAGHESGG